MTSLSRRAGLRRLLLASAFGFGLVAAGAAALAATADQMLRTAETACLDSAAQQGWRRDLARVVSSRSIDPDRVEVVLDLTRDGTNRARLTCPYSVRQGVMGQLAAAGRKIGATDLDQDFGRDFTRSMSTAGDAGAPVNRSRAWWLLLPVGLAALWWAALRGPTAGAHLEPDAAVGAGSRTADAFVAEARSRDGLRDGQVSVHERADSLSLVRRQVPDGDPISLTGRRIDDWLEVDGGGWVREAELRYARATAARGQGA